MKEIPMVSLGGAVLLYLLMVMKNNISISSPAFWIAPGLVIFGIASAYSTLRGKPPPIGRPILGSGLLASGIMAVVFATVIVLIYQTEYSFRCTDSSCLPFFQQDFLVLAPSLALAIAILGLIATGIGARYLGKTTRLKPKQ